MKRIALILTFTISIITGSLLILPQVKAAGPPCPFLYTVKAGDTLSEIAIKSKTNLWQIVHFNRIWNIHFIYVGQVLCLPNPIPDPIPDQQSQSGSQAHSSFNLTVRYEFNREADPDAKNWTLGRNGIGGKQLRYPLFSGNSIETYTDTLDVQLVSVNNSPLLWLAPIDEERTMYTLAVIGDPKPLLDLQMEITPTDNIRDIIPEPDPELIEDGDCPDTNQSIDKLSLSGKNQVSLEGILEATNNIFIPITITEIDYHETAQIAELCYSGVSFALHTMPNPATQGYRLLMVLTDPGNVVGPPGNRWPQYCNYWQGGGWYASFRYYWYGC